MKKYRIIENGNGQFVPQIQESICVPYLPSDENPSEYLNVWKNLSHEFSSIKDAKDAIEQDKSWDKYYKKKNEIVRIIEVE